MLVVGSAVGLESANREWYLFGLTSNHQLEMAWLQR